MALEKTTLFNLIKDSSSGQPGIHLECNCKCIALDNSKYWKQELSEINNSIVFIDEKFKHVASVDFARILRESDNYFVIINREYISTLSYSFDEIYELKTSGKYHGLKHV